MSPICATVLESSTDAVLARMAEVSPRADVIEVRADGVKEGLDLEAIVARRPRPIVLTCRPVREGGLYTGSEEERLSLLEKGARLGAETIDLEWDAFSRARGIPKNTRVVASRHDFAGTIDRGAILASLRACERADVQKLAQTVPDALSALELLALAKGERKPTIAIGMGFPGIATRLLGERSGAPWTYASAGSTPAAPGQLSVEDMSRLLRGRRVGSGTKALGILGKPVSHSRSPALMNAVFAMLGIDAVYAWLETSSPEEILRRTRDDPSWLGFGVTIPHKERVREACDRLDASARKTGAVNTVARSGSEWVGHNTDAPAFADALGKAASERGLSLAGLRVDLLGAGGAARAAAVALSEAGARVFLHDRTEERGKKVASELGVAFAGSLARARADGKPRAIVNATSVGMTPRADETPVGGDAFDEKTIAFDAVYTPEDTRFLALARERGALAVSGMELFVRQARRQLELWLGKHVSQRVSDDWLAARARGSP